MNPTSSSRRPRRSPALLLTLGLLAFGLAGNAVRAQSVSFTVLRTLAPREEGILPIGPLAQGADGQFYGTTARGGAQDQGAVFRLGPDGENFTSLGAFTGAPFSGTRPEGGVIQARDGLFYGTTLAGGVNDRGALFRFDPASSPGAIQVLNFFNLGPPGATPTATLAEGPDGNLYGTAQFGGFSNFGTVFRVGLDGSLLEINEFTASPDGANPAGRLLLTSRRGGDDSLYGATLSGGLANVGTLFRITTDGARQQLFDFSNNADGSLPRALTEGPDGALYGVARTGGLLGVGSVFRIDANGGGFRVLYTFNPNDGTGYNAFGELLLASDGNLYGTTQRGGLSDAGTVFRVTPGGAYATLLSFTGVGQDGGYPQAAVTQGSDGRLYGTAAGIQGRLSTVFRLDLGLPRPRPAIRTLSATAGAEGDTLALTGESFVNASGVRFAGDDGNPVAASSFRVVSARYLLVTVPAGARTGALTVLDADGNPGQPSSVAFTVNAAAPVTPPTVELAAVNAETSLAPGAEPGRVRVVRTDGDPRTAGQPITVFFKLKPGSTAVRDVDYALSSGGVALPAGANSVVVPANATGVELLVTPLGASPTAAGSPDRTVKLKLVADPAGAYGTGANLVKVTIHPAS